MRRLFVVLVAALLVLQSATGRIPFVAASGSKIPIKASVSTAVVQRGDQELLFVNTVSGAHISVRVVYPVRGGFKTRGIANKRGHWQHKWEVHADYPGEAAVHLQITARSKVRNYTVHFTVGGPATPTIVPTNTPVPRPTITPAPPGPPSFPSFTPWTATPTPYTRIPTTTPVGTATNTPVPSVTPGGTATPSPSGSATPGPSPTPLPTVPTAQGTILLSNVSFSTSSSCPAASSNQQTAFPNTTSTIYLCATLPKWVNQHEVDFIWNDPNGNSQPSAAPTVVASHNGQVVLSDHLDMTQGNANILGYWIVAVVIDYNIAAIVSFDLYSDSPPDTSGNLTPRPSDPFDLYPILDQGGNPPAKPQYSYTASSPTVYAYIAFSDWTGVHTVTFTWIAPDGSTYHTYTDTDIAPGGPSSDFSEIGIAGQDAATHPGTWTVKVSLDGQVYQQKQFTIGS